MAELKKIIRNAPKSGLLISTRKRTIAEAVSCSQVSFECVEPEGSRARKILDKAECGDNYEEMISNLDTESEYVEILEVCAGLPLALGIAGSGLHEEYADSRNRDGRKDPSFAVGNYWKGLKRGSMEYLQYANIDYHRDGQKYVVEASLKSCEAWGRSGGRNYDMKRLFRSLCILEKQNFLPKSTLKLYWGSDGLDEMDVRMVLRKFANLNIMSRKRVGKSVVKDEEYLVRLYDLVLELCTNIVAS